MHGVFTEDTKETKPPPMGTVAVHCTTPQEASYPDCDMNGAAWSHAIRRLDRGYMGEVQEVQRRAMGGFTFISSVALAINMELLSKHRLSSY